jgi:glycosyltransferase involved in cell wall biosynthesis
MEVHAMKDSLYVVMPAYNEEANIVSVVEEWYPVVEARNDASRLVIADGGSKDRTLEILQGLARKLPRLEVVSMPGTDHGTKVLWLYRHAVERGAEWVFQTDSDGQTRASEFDSFWSDRERYDAILGNRVARGDGFRRKIVELGLRLFVLAYFGIWIPDANAPFRLMRSSVLRDFLPLMPDTFNLPNAVVAACFAKHGDHVAFRPITFRSRQGGKNFMNYRRIAGIAVGSLRNFHRVRQEMKKAGIL